MDWTRLEYPSASCPPIPVFRFVSFLFASDFMLLWQVELHVREVYAIHRFILIADNGDLLRDEDDNETIHSTIAAQFQG